MKATKELKTMNAQNLKQKLNEISFELMKENAQIAIGTVPKNPGKIRVMKKTIARIQHLLKTQEVSKKA